VRITQKDALSAAIAAAKQSPCAKSKRGAVIWNPDIGICGIGYNHTPAPFICGQDDTCREACSKINVHAEQAALLNFRRSERANKSLRDFDMLHVKVVDDVAVPSGPPSCWQCSKLILACGIKGVWLLHENGLQRYWAVDFHYLTLEHAGLPRVGYQYPLRSNQ